MASVKPCQFFFEAHRTFETRQKYERAGLVRTSMWMVDAITIPPMGRSTSGVMYTFVNSFEMGKVSRLSRRPTWSLRCIQLQILQHRTGICSGKSDLTERFGRMNYREWRLEMQEI